MTRIFPLAIAAFIAPSWVVAAPCPGNPQALGTERVIEIDAKSTPRVGRKQFPSTLPLGAKELVLTFDDGPWPRTTSKVLDALKNECVRATFFLLGRNATAHPQLARRVLSEDTPSDIIATRIRFLARCRLPRQRLKSTAALRPMSSPFTAKDARTPQRLFFGFPASPPTSLSSLA